MATRVIVPAAKEIAKATGKTVRRRRPLRAPLQVTTAAAEQVKEIMSTNDNALGVRLGVKTST
jgi:hypothetical protein